MVRQEFLSQLKQLGFSISTAELIDVMRVTEYATDIQELRTGVRGVLCKSLPEQKIFDILFDMYISGVALGEKTATERFREELVEMMEGDRPQAESQIDPIRLGIGMLVERQLRGVQSDYKLAMKKLFNEGESAAARHILLRYIMPSSNTFSDILQKKDRVMASINNSLRSAFPELADTGIQTLEQALVEEIKEMMRSREKLGLSSSLTALTIEDRPIIELEDSVELQHSLRVFAKSIASKRSKMQRSRKRLDMRRTIRKNIQRGGVLIEQVKRNRVKSKPKILVMTDVSPSTMHASKLFLSIIQMVRNSFSDIHYYEFIGSLIDVTTEVKRSSSIHNSIDRILQKWKEVKGGKESSDYQQALKEFVRSAGQFLTSSYTVIILGDCRDWLGGWRDGKPISTDIIESICSKTKGVYIFNPEPVEQWDRGDSVVSHYRNSGAVVLETLTLRQLAKNLELVISK